MENILVEIKPQLSTKINKLIKETNISTSTEEFINSAVRSYLIKYRAKHIRKKTRPLIHKLRKRGYVPKPITQKVKIKTADNYLKKKGLTYNDLS